MCFLTGLFVVLAGEYDYEYWQHITENTPYMDFSDWNKPKLTVSSILISLHFKSKSFEPVKLEHL